MRVHIVGSFLPIVFQPLIQPAILTAKTRRHQAKANDGEKSGLETFQAEIGVDSLWKKGLGIIGYAVDGDSVSSEGAV